MAPRAWHAYYINELNKELWRIRAVEDAMLKGSITANDIDGLGVETFPAFVYLARWLRDNKEVDYNRFVNHRRVAAGLLAMKEPVEKVLEGILRRWEEIRLERKRKGYIYM